MRQIAMAAIRLYQRHISPHKGFCCAYRAMSGRASCSEVGLRVIRRFGLLEGMRLLKLRLARCANVYREQSARYARPLLQQRGDCDPGCDAGCGLDDVESVSGLCDRWSCSNWGPCEGFGQDKKSRSERRVARRKKPKAAAPVKESPPAG